MPLAFNSKHFGKLVRRAIAERGLSYREAAIEMHINYQALWRVCHGQAPSMTNHMRIVDWCKVNTGVDVTDGNWY